MRRFVLWARKLRWVFLGMLFSSYFGSLWVAALHFPHGYDWRRNVISNLLSPRDNPGWRLAPSVGVMMAGLCMLPLAMWIDSELGDCGSSLASRVRRPAFLVGIGCLILAAVVAPQHSHRVMGLRHAHELLARASAVGLGVGMLCACLARPGAGIGSAASEERGKRLRALRRVWWVITAPPILGALGSGVIVGLARLHELAGVAGYLRGTVFWRLAFWEWVGSAAVFLFFAAPVVMLRNYEL